MATVYKICPRKDWAAAEVAGRYKGSADDRRDGFIHLSARHQLETTAAKHFAGEDGLWLLALDADGLGDALRWEPSRGGQLFPHLHRALRRQDVLWARPLPLGAHGHVFPDDLT